MLTEASREKLFPRTPPAQLLTLRLPIWKDASPAHSSGVTFVVVLCCFSRCHPYLASPCAAFDTNLNLLTFGLNGRAWNVHACGSHSQTVDEHVMQ